MLKNSKTQFGLLSKLLHWSIFLLIGIQSYLTWQFYNAPDNAPEQAHYMFLHKSVGITILLVTIIFLIWKTINVHPLLPKTSPHWQHFVSTIVHYSLLALMIAIPIAGYSISCTANRSISYFDLFTLPCLISQNKALSGILYFVHVYLVILFMVLISVHVVAALYHHFILKDDVLKRIL